LSQAEREQEVLKKKKRGHREERDGLGGKTVTRKLIVVRIPPKHMKITTASSVRQRSYRGKKTEKVHKTEARQGPGGL